MAEMEFLNAQGAQKVIDKLKSEDAAVKTWVTSEAKAHSSATADSATTAETANSATTAASADNATTAETASKLGTETVGSETQPIYLDEGVAKPANAPFSPSGASSDIMLGDGSTKAIATLLTENIETIRTGLGLATKEHMGLVPQLPENPEVGS